MNAYVGYVVRRKGTTAPEGTVDAYDADAALVWWGYQRGHKKRCDGQRWVRWSELEIVYPKDESLRARGCEVRRE